MPDSIGRSVADVLKDIASSLQEIVRSEIQLAKIERELPVSHLPVAAF